jgi:ubiquinone/menaquinone biosynthesis C-methylase UbiE
MNKSKNKSINESMSRYYDELAAEYELIYSGDNTLFQHDAAVIAKFLPELVGPAHVDLACGTGYWLQFYHRSCERITLIDQSPRMLTACRAKIRSLDLESKASIVQADLLALPFPHGRYDSALLGFFWSHLSLKEEARVFAGLRGMLAPNGRLILIDSAWKEGRERETVQTRSLADGKSYTVRKRYLDEGEIEAMEKRQRMAWRVLYRGKAFILAEGAFSV